MVATTEQRTQRKKVLAFLLVAICCMAACVAGTAAYYTTETTAENTITTGGVDAVLTGNGFSAENPDDDMLDEIVIIDFMPGTTVERSAALKCTGPDESWVRMLIDVQITLEDGTDGDAGLVAMNTDISSKWVYSDGFYYYTEPLTTGDVTDELFTTITFSGQMGNEYQHCVVTVHVTGYAVQTIHNGDTVLEAAGWPEA